MGKLTPNTRKAAEKLLALRLQQLHSSDFIEPSTMPFDELTIKWVDKYARDQVKSGTNERMLDLVGCLDFFCQ